MAGHERDVRFSLDTHPTGASGAALLLLWLVGLAARLTILAVPAVIADIRAALGLNATQVGLLNSVPPALFALAAIAGSLLVVRIGLRPALLVGLLTTCIGSALRGVSVGYLGLLAMSVVMSAGVAVLQPVVPMVVQRWAPGRIGLATALYGNGLLVGAVLPVLLTPAWVMQLANGSWRGSLVLWSVPIAVIAAAVFFFSPPVESDPEHSQGTSGRWLPDWRSSLVWKLGGAFLCVNSIYFSANAFLPIYLRAVGRGDLAVSALLALNFGQLPASFLLLFLARRLEGRDWPFVVSGLGSLIAIVGLIFGHGAMTIVWAALLGFCNGAALVLGFTLPPLLCQPGDVARTSAGTFTISYSGTVLIAIICGAAWDISLLPALALVPLAICALALVPIIRTLRLSRTSEGRLACSSTLLDRD